MKNSKKEFTLAELLATINKKISAKEKGSYSYSLFKEGIEKINRKVGEEALETVIGSFIYKQNKNAKNRKELVGEICDLFYHTLVLMAAQEIKMEDVLDELNKRNKKHE